MILICSNDESFINRYLTYDECYLVLSDSIMKSEKAHVKYILYSFDKSMLHEETFRIVDDINSLIEDEALLNEKHLYKYSKLIEGGETQKLADFLWWLDYYIDIIKKYEITYIVIDHKLNDIRKQALYSCARSYGIGIKGGKRSIKRKVIKSLLIRMYSVAQVLYYNMQADGRGYNNSVDILYVLGQFSDAKHLNWTKRELLTYGEDITTCVVATKVRKSKQEEITNISNNLVILEKYLKLKDMLLTVVNYKRDVLTLEKKIVKFEYYYRDVIISPIVNKYFYEFQSQGVFENCVYDSMVKNFARENTSKLMTGKGDMNFPLIRSIFYCLKEDNPSIMLFKDASSLALTMGSGYACSSKPFDIEQPSIVFWAAGCVQKDIWIREGWNQEWHYVKDTYEDTMDIKYDDTINSTPVVLWAPTYPSVGFYSLQALISHTVAIYNYSKKENWEFYIKWHPSMPAYMENIIRPYINNYNDVVLDKKKSIFEFLNRVDIFFSCASTAIMDAAAMGKCVICMEDETTKKYLDMLEDYFCICKEHDFDEHTIRDYYMLGRWKERQQAFFEEKNKPDLENISEVLKKYI